MVSGGTSVSATEALQMVAGRRRWPGAGLVNRSKRLRLGGTVALLAVTVLAAWFFLANPGGVQFRPGMKLTSGTDFSLTGSTVSNLAPGISQNMTVAAANPLPVSIDINSLTVTVSSDPATCHADTYLSAHGSSFAGNPRPPGP